MLFHASLEQRVTSESCRISALMSSDEFCRVMKLREATELALQHAAQVESSVTDWPLNKV